MQNNPQGIGFTPVTPKHYVLLREWLERPHWAEWWGDPETELSYIVDMVEGRDTTRPFIFDIAGEQAGYIQYWFIGHHQNETWMKDHPWLAALPKDAIGVDLSIGNPDNLSKGYGTAVLQSFVAKLRGEGFETIIIDPDPENRRAVRAYQKAGFRPLKSLEGRTEGVLIMQHQTDENEITL